MPIAKSNLLQRRFLGVAGDWHGQIDWIRIALNIFFKSGISTVIQLGDFGLMGDIPRFIHRVNKYLVQLDMTLLVVPGNHENYSFINKDDNFHIDENGIRWFIVNGGTRSRVGLLPRGFKWEQNGKILMALGGASSIDFTSRVKGKTWWEEENITESEADSIIADLHGGGVDVMFTHDAPRDVFALAEHAVSTASDWELSELAYAETSRARLDRVFRCAQPKLLMHGHWHLPVDERGEFESNWESNGDWSNDVVDTFESHIVGLDLQNSVDNLAVLDLDTLKTITLGMETAIETGKPVGERRIFAD